MKKIVLDNNSKNVVINMINSLIVKGGAMIVIFLTTPAYMNYFKDDTVLGLWFTILSVLTWILSFDMGIGNGLRNRLVEALISNDREMIERYISSSYIFLCIVSGLLGILIYGLSFVINWNIIFNISEVIIAPDLLRNCITIILISILLQFVLRLISSILFALQKAFIPNLLALITNSLLLIYVLLCNYSGNNNDILGLARFYLVAVNLPLIITTVIIFSTELKSLRPRLSYFDYYIAIDTLKVGGMFLILQIEALMLNNTSVFLITFLLGANVVVEYNVYLKIFSMVSTLFAIITVPMWSAITKAISEKNYNWIKRSTRVLQVIAIIFSASQIVLFPIMHVIFDIWLGEKTFKPELITMVFFSLEQVAIIWTSLNSAICNGLSELKWQPRLMTISAILMIPLSILMAKITNNYLGIIIAHCISLLPYCIGQSIWLEKFFLKNLKSKSLDI